MSRFLPTSKNSWKLCSRFQESSSNSPGERPLHTPSRIRSAASTRAVSSIGDVLAPQPCRSTCEVDYSSVQAQKRTDTGGRVRSGSGCDNNETRAHRSYQRRRIRRGRAPAARRPCSGGARSVHPFRVIVAALEARVREDLTTLEEARRWERHAEEYPLHHCGHLRRLRGVIVMVTRDLDEGRIGGFERQHALLCQIYEMLESATKDSCSNCPTPTPDQTSTGCLPMLSQSSHCTGKRLRSRQQESNTGN